MFETFPDLLVPVFIYFARIVDVSLGTLRIVMVSKGFKLRAVILSFVEILIWAVVIAQLLQNLDHWVNYVAFAGGFATGTFVGMYIEDKLRMGTILVRVITREKSTQIMDALKLAGMGITAIQGKGGFNDVTIIFSVLKRKRWDEMVRIIKENDPEAFYSAEDVKYASSTSQYQIAEIKRTPFNRLLGMRKSM